MYQHRGKGTYFRNLTTLSTQTHGYGDPGFLRSLQSAVCPTAAQSQQIQHWGWWLGADPSCRQPHGCRLSLSLPRLVPPKPERVYKATTGPSWHVLV